MFGESTPGSSTQLIRTHSSSKIAIISDNEKKKKSDLNIVLFVNSRSYFVDNTYSKKRDISAAATPQDDREASF